MTDNTQIKNNNTKGNTQITTNKQIEIETAIKKNPIKEAVFPKIKALSKAMRKDDYNPKDPQQISIGLDKFENKLIKNRKHIV